MATPQVAIDPLGFGRLAAQNVQNRQLSIQEQDAASRGELQDLQIQSARGAEQSRLGTLARQQQMQQGLAQALTSIPEGGNRFSATHSFFVQNGFTNEANELITNQLAQLEQIEKIDQAAADQGFNQTVGLVQGLTAKTDVDQFGKILNLTNQATGKVQSFRETPGTAEVKGEDGNVVSPAGMTLIEGFVEGGAIDPDLIKSESALRKEFVKDSGEFIKSRDSIGRVREAGKDPSAAGDLALIFNFMKVLDPGSVVRESEFRTASNAKAFLNEQEKLGKEIPNFVQQGINKLLTGQKLLDPQRKDFLARAEKLFKPISRSHKKREGQFKKIARNNRFNVDNVVLDLSIDEFEQETQAQPTAAEQTTTVETPTGAAALATAAAEQPAAAAGFKVVGIR